ncbi:MAG: ribosomal protein L13e [Nitrososphaerota archaeon]|nr:ribosomal protein L13e [Candidatus Bathyarchaeota archaeon]MDW8022950.1 ribosomal protein L13e [Nitrososphaerota archaeon]
MTAIKPLVFKKCGKPRTGKGFSLNELKKAKLSVKTALKLQVPVDPRRRTIHEENVKALIDFIENKRVSSKPEKKRKEKT